MSCGRLVCEEEHKPLFVWLVAIPLSLPGTSTCRKSDERRFVFERSVITMDGRTEIEIIQEFWTVMFGETEWTISERAAENLLRYANNDRLLVLDAIEKCTLLDAMKNRTLDNRLAYTFGIIKNLKRDRARVTRSRG
jgi:hypothetical protein